MVNPEFVTHLTGRDPQGTRVHLVGWDVNVVPDVLDVAAALSEKPA